MATYKLTESAHADIEDLINYTIDNWGIEQAEKYYSGLTKQAQLLADMPTLGKFYERYDQLRVFPYQEHMIYFVQVSQGITITNVTHKSMDQTLHIKPMD